MPKSSPARALGVLALCFFFNFVSRGVADSFTVFLLPLQAQFGWNRAQMTSVYSTIMLATGIASPFAGMVFERFGPRVLYVGGVGFMGAGYLIASQANALWQFYLGIGLLGGIGGSALGMVPAAALLGRWFGPRLGTAIGIAYGGLGCGSLVIVPLAQALIDGFGWRAAYGTFCGSLLLVCLSAAVLPWKAIAAGLTPGSHRARTGASTGTLRTALVQRRFWLLVQVMFFTAFGMNLITVQSVAYLVDLGYTPLQAATAFGAAAMLSIFGISSSGWLSDRFGHRNAATVSFVGTALGMGMLYAMTFHKSDVLLVAYVLLFGICQGARGPVVAGLSARLFSGPGQATIFGAIFACMSVGTGLGALLSGALHDWTGGYRAGFLLALVSIAFAAAPFWTSGSALSLQLREKATT